jgi:hypothetical protein
MLINRFWGRKKAFEHPHNRVRRNVNSNSIRTRIQSLGWHLHELPRRSGESVNWKIVAVKGEKSVEVGGETFDEAMKNIGTSLGVIPNE